MRLGTKKTGIKQKEPMLMMPHRMETDTPRPIHSAWHTHRQQPVSRTIKYLKSILMCNVNNLFAPTEFLHLNPTKPNGIVRVRERVKAREAKGKN